MNKLNALLLPVARHAGFADLACLAQDLVSPFQPQIRRYLKRGLGIKIKWPSTGADGGVLRAWWLAVNVVGRPAGQFLAHGGGQQFRVRYLGHVESRGALIMPWGR